MAGERSAGDGTIERIGVLGAGTMGAGIAQVAAEAGIPVYLHDPLPGAVERALRRIGVCLDRRVEKGQLTADGRDAALARIHPAVQPRAPGRCRAGGRGDPRGP